MTPPTGNAGRRGWDPLVRLTHWGIALAVLLNGLLLEEGKTFHVWVGYAAFGLLLLRLLWGLVGTGNARFSSFPPSLSAARAHLRDLLEWRHRDYPSHTPLGAWMAYTLWALLLVVALTGVAMENDPFPQNGGEEPAGWASYFSEHDEEEEDEHGEGRNGEHDDEEGLLGEVHETAANLILILAALHVAGVGVESRLSGVNLVRRMLPGTNRDA